MISGLHGILESRGQDWVTVNVAGVSYQVFVPTSTLAALGGPGDRVDIHTYLQVREDSLTLFGFATSQEKQLFELLLTVNGVGPKLALGMLSSAPVERLVSSIVSGDEDALMAVPGIGKKTASRLVLELKARLEKEWGPVAAPAGAADADALAALVALGYSQAQARAALAGVGAGKRLPLEEKVRLALQRLAGR